MRSERSYNILGQTHSASESQKLDINFTKRHRLGGKPGRWFHFDDGTPLHEVAATAASYLYEEETW